MAFQANAFQNNAFQLVTGGYGPDGIATLVPSVESGAEVTYRWQTDVSPALDGTEQRASVLARPRQTYSFSTLLSDAQTRGMLSLLARRAADAPIFLLALPHEDASIVSATSSTITIHSVTYLDWAAEGQRVAVVSSAGVVGEAVVQSVVGTTLEVDEDLTAIADGGRIMPLVPVYLEAEQELTRYQVNIMRWDLVARALLPDFAGGAVGTGATVATFEGIPVWDRGIAKRQAAQPLFSGAEMVDLGGALSQLGPYAQAAWGRALRATCGGGRAAAERQWLKLFLDTIQGQRGAFLLPSGRPDLVAIGDASSGTLTVVGPPVTDAPDYAGSWFPSLAHRRLRIVLADGTAALRRVTAVAAGTGSQELALTAPVTGAIARVEFLETCRLQGEAVTVKWEGRMFEADLAARVVQG